MSNESEFLTINEASEYLKLGRRTLYKYMDDGILPYYILKPSGRRRLKRQDLDALMTRHVEIPEPE